MHHFIEPTSRRLAYMRYGRVLLEPYGLHFGISASPSKFQQANRLVVSILNDMGYHIGLYLDDRGCSESISTELKAGQTGYGQGDCLKVSKSY